MNIVVTYRKSINPFGEKCFSVTVKDADRREAISGWGNSVHEKVANGISYLKALEKETK